MATTTTLLNLPTEILHQITRDFSYASQIALSLTCRDLHGRVKDPNLRLRFTSSLEKDTPYTMEDLLEIELWPEFAPSFNRAYGSKQMPSANDFFACGHCRKIRSAIKFTNSHLSRPYLKRGLGEEKMDWGDDRTWRMCIPCGVAVSMWPRGRSYPFGGMSGGYGFTCYRCGGFQAERLGFEGEKVNFMCDSCHGSINEKQEPFST
ncbi:hypothetical protein V490_00959 [Pseudogymnoascus sp. VKM F-3557]|nr:hypothetical protein V490_00959 [Pseudogymnoascus sp. VKM F-3557]